jgi:hypothetical protein
MSVQLYDTAGLYDPTTDSWTSTSTFEAASARGGRTAVWTGTFMLIWGGYTGDFLGPEFVLISGGRYISGQSFDDDGDGYTECGGDCADNNSAVHPGAVEVCNGIDDNCSATADERCNALCDDANACTTASVWLAPAAVTNFVVSTASPASLSWDSQAVSSGPGRLYDLASGTMGPAGGTVNFTLASCLQSSSPRPIPIPVPGCLQMRPSGTWRGRNSCGNRDLRQHLARFRHPFLSLIRPC